MLGERGTLVHMSASIQHLRLGDMTASAFAAAARDPWLSCSLWVAMRIMARINPWVTTCSRI